MWGPGRQLSGRGWRELGSWRGLERALRILRIQRLGEADRADQVGGKGRQEGRAEEANLTADSPAGPPRSLQLGDPTAPHPAGWGSLSSPWTRPHPQWAQRDPKGGSSVSDFGSEKRRARVSPS